MICPIPQSSVTGSRHGGLTLLLPTATDTCSSMGGAYRSSRQFRSEHIHPMPCDSLHSRR